MTPKEPSALVSAIPSARLEEDALGTRLIANHIVYGIQTVRAVENFSISGRTIADIEGFVPAILTIKQAAARANRRDGKLEPGIADAIDAAASGCLAETSREHFPVDIYHGGGGTAANMNVNEVLANEASEILTGRLGPDPVHPNTHVNMSQSTNDVIPSAMKMAVGGELDALCHVLNGLIAAISQKEAEFSGVVKLARTCLQDALPITFGQQFSGYRGAFERHVQELKRLEDGCLSLPLGATAVGTGFGATANYRAYVFEELRSLTGKAYHAESNSFDALQNADFWIGVSAGLKATAVSLSKFASDLRLMSSGPRAGLSEITLPPVQPGSSIMPGKVNPVMPEMIMQVAFRVIGNDATVTRAAEGELDLNVWESIILESLSESIRLMRRAIPLFAYGCVKGLTVNSAVANRDASSSLALSTALAEIFGYPAALRVAKHASSNSISISRAVVECGLLDEKGADRLFRDVSIFANAEQAEDIIHSFRRPNPLAP
ncbi:aspartate ammonia-lyase [Agrobacterium sp. T29]|uniref:aspartate ammonia-lyase n=1 Tax=Agrobacterium sp. T29 TaxID=2580515 RepID=UPI00115D4C06|nr:aspartate ammonia-lyase [Agrobacterium sp. T29]